MGQVPLNSGCLKAFYCWVGSERLPRSRKPRMAELTEASESQNCNATCVWLCLKGKKSLLLCWEPPNPLGEVIGRYSFMSHHAQSFGAVPRFWPFLCPHLTSIQMSSSCFVCFGFWFLFFLLFFFACLFFCNEDTEDQSQVWAKFSRWLQSTKPMDLFSGCVLN